MIIGAANSLTPVKAVYLGILPASEGVGLLPLLAGGGGGALGCVIVGVGVANSLTPVKAVSVGLLPSLAGGGGGAMGEPGKDGETYTWL